MTEPGRYGLVAAKGSISLGIRLLTHSWASHAFVVIGDGKIIEADPSGVIISDLSKYDGCRLAFNTEEELSELQRAEIVATAYSMIADPYNWADIAALGFRSLGFKASALFRLAGINSRALICSQLVAMAGQAAGVDWLCGRESPLYVTPGDLARRPGVRPL